jgi:heptaprenyl diphosphate synthase/octaprenyl-diphosphate synthase
MRTEATSRQGALDSAATKKTSNGVLDAFAPVADQLLRVRERLLELADDQSPFLAELLDHVLDTTGKGIRPAITLLSSGFHANDGTRAETMAVAVELLHLASLVHDDTVDNAVVRRGKATVGSIWGRNAAVLVGDFIFATSAVFVCDTENVRVIRRFSETIRELSSGELDEMAGSYNYQGTREDYLKRIYGKTASLFRTSSESGAVLSGASDDQVLVLNDYGYNLGMAFQIADDILDFQGSAEEAGKPVGNDLSQGVLTLPAIIAIERNPEDNAVIALCRRPGDPEVLAAAVELCQDSSVMDEASAVADRYTGLALESLAHLEQNAARDSLEGLVTALVGRRS